MRLFALLYACSLLSAPYVAAEENSVLSITTNASSSSAANLDAGITVMALTGLATSTLDSSVGHKGTTAYNCTTYTTIFTHSYTRTQTSTTEITTLAESTESITATSDLGTEVNGTDSGNTVSANTSTGVMNSGIGTDTGIETTTPTTIYGHESTGIIPTVATMTSAEHISSTRTFGDLNIVVDVEGNTITVSTMSSTAMADSGQTISTTSTKNDGVDDTMPVPSTCASTASTSFLGMATTTNEDTPITFSNSLSSTADGLIYGGIITSTTDEYDNIITVPNSAPQTTATSSPGIVMTTDSEGNTFTVPCTGSPSCLPRPILPSDVISSSMSAISSEFRALLSTFSSWEINPEPPLQTSIINGVEGVEHRIEDLVGTLGGKNLPKCSKNKRGLLDSLFDIAADALDTIISALSCITSNIENLKKEINAKDIEAVRSLLPKLISLDDKPISPTPSFTTSTTSSSSCTSATAHQVTVLCEPTLITSLDPAIDTITCSPTTTVTITGCSATDTTTTITSSPTPTQMPCGQDSCDGAACPVGGGGWVTLYPIDCAKVPTVTVGGLPSVTYRPDHTVPPRASRRVYIKPDHANPADPLPSVPSQGSDLTDHLSNLAERLTTEGQWLSHKKGDTTGKWYSFANENTAAGVIGLFGCTSIIMVSKHGVYLSHIYEDPVFVQKTKLGFLRPTPADAFQKASYDALVNGDPESGELEPLSSLIGTIENPGPLHYTFQPKIFAVTPFKHGGIGPLMYAKRIESLISQLHNLLYPAGSEQYDQKPEALPYKIAPQYLAENPKSLSGKIIMEATQLDHYEQSGDQDFAMGHWRLWVNGKETVTWEFSSQNAVTAVGHGLHVPKARGAICPVSTLSSTPTSSTFATTTKPLPSTPTTTPTTASTSILSTTTNPPPVTTATMTTTSASGASPLPSDPSLIGKPQCYEHSDSSPTTIDPSTVQALADKCFDGTTIPSDKLSLGGSGDPTSISWTVDNYFAKIKFDPRCKGPAQNPQYPMEGYDCGSIIKENFALKSCVTKDGFGGSLRIGCLVYSSYVKGRG